VASALGLLGDLLPQRMLELGEQRIGGDPLVELAAAFDVGAMRIAFEQSLCPLD
jgi:hypothetical protein